MTNRFLACLFIGALVLGLGCVNQEPVGPSSQGPRFQHDTGFLTFDVRVQDFTTCTRSAPLNLQLVGWVQTRAPIPGDFLPFHLEFIYSNAAGETYVWKQTGIERPYVDNAGDRILSVAGQTGNDGTVARVLVNLTRGGVQIVRGNVAFGEDLACAALT